MTSVEAVRQQQRVTIRRETITPEIATRWLERNTTNRSLVQATVEEYARDMTSGKWHFTGDAIQFGISGRLLNGQHRLWASVLSDASFEAIVVRGLENEDEVMDVIDTGRKRTLAHSLQIHGEKDSNLLAAIINNCYVYETHGRIARGGYPTHEEALEWLRENPDAREGVLLARRAYAAVKIPPGVAGSAYYLNARADAEASAKFWDLTTTGEGLMAGSAVLAYRRWIVNAIAKRDRPRPEVWFEYTLKAMNVWRAGKKLRTLQVKPEEQPILAWKA